MNAIQPKKRSLWQRFVNWCNIAAEACNIGIAIEILAKIPYFLFIVSSGAAVLLARITEPAIYFFRALGRVGRVIGREFFDIEFEEEKHGTHQYQTFGDLAVVLLFSLAIAAFVHSVVAAAAFLFAAWTLALTGLSIIYYFDYVHPEQQAKEKYDRALESPEHTPEQVHELKDEYESKKNSKRLYFALLIGLSFLLLCGSAAAIAPAFAVGALLNLSSVASIYLSVIAVGRFLNWCGVLNKIINWFSGKDSTQNLQSELTEEPLSEEQDLENGTSTRKIMDQVPASPNQQELNENIESSNNVRENRLSHSSDRFFSLRSCGNMSNIENNNQANDSDSDFSLSPRHHLNISSSSP